MKYTLAAFVATIGIVIAVDFTQWKPPGPGDGTVTLPFNTVTTDTR